MKAKKTKQKSDKIYKVLKALAVILILFLIIEVIYFGFKFYNIRKNTVYYETANSIIKTDNGYLTVGLSDFKNSKLTTYEKPGYNKAVISIYDENLNKIKETKLKLGYSSVYNSVISVKDGYIAVGSVSITKEQNDVNNTEAIIVKYDKDLNEVWIKNLQILDTSKFVNVKEDDNGNIIVVGQSIYEENIIGNHTTGGAILIRYTSDGEVDLKINLGGPATDIFNDFIITKNGYIAVGIKSTGTGIIYKYDFNGKELWHEYYGYTDKEGLTSITSKGDNFLVTATKLEEKGSTDKYKAAILLYDKDGKLLKEKFFEEANITKFQKVAIDEEKIIVLGIYGKKINEALSSNAKMFLLDSDFKVIKSEILTGDQNITLTDIVITDNDYILSGHTNSKIKEFNSNGYDYFPILKKYKK